MVDDDTCATCVHDDVSLTALRYTRYPATPADPPLTSSSVLTALHSMMIEVSLGAPTTATVSGAAGAVVSAPAPVSITASRQGVHTLAVSLTFTLIAAESADPNQLRVRV